MHNILYLYTENKFDLQKVPKTNIKHLKKKKIAQNVLGIF